MKEDLTALMHTFWNKHDFCRVHDLGIINADGTPIADEYDEEVSISVNMIIKSYSAKKIVRVVTDRMSGAEKSEVKAARKEMERIVYEYKKFKKSWDASPTKCDKFTYISPVSLERKKSRPPFVYLGVD